jgi:hypothetical protein
MVSRACPAGPHGLPVHPAGSPAFHRHGRHLRPDRYHYAHGDEHAATNPNGDASAHHRTNPRSAGIASPSTRQGPGSTTRRAGPHRPLPLAAPGG